jgi:putative lipoic acid-binding regulatory protein
MTDTLPKANRALLEFPCDFVIKVFGQSSEEFETTVLMIVHKHIPNLSDRAVQSRSSENGNYRALSITVHVESKEQLDNLYQELSASPVVLMAL